MSKFGSLRWCLQLTDEEWAAFFTSVGTQGNNILKKMNTYSGGWSPSDYARSIYSHMEAVSAYPNANKYQKYKVWKLTFKIILPSLQSIQSYGTDETPTNYTYHIREAFKKLTDWRKYQVELAARKKRAEGSIIKELQSNFVETVAPLQKLPVGLIKPFESIMALHATASLLQLTVEDQYFVEQVKEDYLPAIAIAASRIQSASAEAQAEANKNFNEQLNLIKKRLDTIIRESEQKVLAEVRAQTHFLEASNKKELTA